MTSRASEPDRPSRSPAAAEVTAELDRVLGSEAFAQAGRATEFLRYVVQQTLAGHGDRLKGYTIGVEVFGRPDDFDAQTDPFVRVEAGRLRRRLVEYYAGEGRRNSIRIELARGTYVPKFLFAPTQDTPAATPARRRASNARYAFAVAALAGIVTLAWLLRAAGPTEPPAGAGESAARAIPSGPRLLVVPYSNLSGDSDLDYFAYGITEEIILRLSAFDLLVVVGHTGLDDETRRPEVTALRDDIGFGYVLSGSVRGSEEHIRITPRLTDAQTGIQLWTAVYDEDSSVRTLLAIQESIAEQVAATIAVPFGPIFDLEAERTIGSPVDNLEAYECVLRYYYYTRTFSPREHERVLDCFERAVQVEPAFAEAWAGLSHVYFDEHRFAYNRQADRRDPLDRAREAARTALDIDGNSRLAGLAMARIRFSDGDMPGFDAIAERLLSRAPNHTETLALIGMLWALSGQWDRGLPLVEKAVAISSRPPAWFHAAGVFDALRRGDYEGMLDRALRIDASEWYVAPLCMAVAAALAGRDDLAERSLARLLELRPDYANEARDDLSRWQFEPLLLDSILEGLREAGLDAV